MNAQKYTQNGFIKFQIKALISKKQVLNDEKSNNDYQYTSVDRIHKTQFIKFEIEDSGLGIPEDKINAIFNLFEYEFMTLNTINQHSQ